RQTRHQRNGFSFDRREQRNAARAAFDGEGVLRSKSDPRALRAVITKKGGAHLCRLRSVFVDRSGSKVLQSLSAAWHGDCLRRLVLLLRGPRSGGETRLG